MKKHLDMVILQQRSVQKVKKEISGNIQPYFDGERVTKKMQDITGLSAEMKIIKI